MTDLKINDNTIIIATNNAHKMVEFKKKFKGYEVLCLKDIGYLDDIEENGTTFEENAVIKAKTVSEYLQSKGIFVPVLAEDAGLCVNALNGEPGIYSARYGGGDHDDQANRNKLLKKLKGVKDRSAYFSCTLVKYYPDGKYICAVGTSEGHITHEELGDKSFGYECVFYSNLLGKTYGECTKDEKNKVSHRSRAIDKLLSME